MTRFLISLTLVALCFISGSAQTNANALKLNCQEAESLFLHRNRSLIAEKMNISIDDARIAEAKVWDNPELNIDDINFWKKKPEDTDGEPMESVAQFSLELSQMISISSRRSKLANLEKANKQISIKEYEQFLRELKTELRSVFAQIIYLQDYKILLDSQNASVDEIMEGYKKLYKNGDISLNELIRVESYQLSVSSEINQCNLELNSLYSSLKSMLAINAADVVTLEDEQDNFPSPESMSYESLINLSLENNPELEASRLYTEYFKRDISYQRSLAVPDISLSVKYDRYGGVWKNFFGVGVGVPIPILNRNKSGIKIARIQQEQNEIRTEEIKNTIENEVAEALNNYTSTYNFFSSASAKESFVKLDIMFERYTKSLFGKEISLVEYIDFIESIKETKDILIKTEYDLKLQLNRLEYLTGTEINR